MAGTAITSLPSAAAISGFDVGSGSTLTPSVVNEFRIAAVADRLGVHVVASHKMDMNEFFNLCLSLARGIDYAVANNEVPGRVQDLPRLLKQVCQQNADALLQAAIMVLMISVKNACRSGWFPTNDSTELLTLADEIGSNFCTVREMNTELSNSVDIISTIMARFYPRMKLGQILTFLEVKPGYGTFVVDFHISKISKPSAEEKIRLFVAQTDNVETSSCIITPPQVNFLLNGKGVDKRTTVIMDTGPQVPTVVTQMLKFGTNLLQAVGQFNGSYVIVVAYMNVISNPDPPVLQDYVHPTVAPLDSDSDIIEGASRVTLNCPISFRRITTPVKGHSCNHFQCFDFDNFVDMNSRRPAWRCPHCNQSVCFVDLRVDQNMVKVLKEVEENAVDVIISVDGSWKPVVETNDKTDQPLDESLNQQQEGPALQEGPTQQEGPAQKESDIPSDVMDLTVEDDVMDIDELMYDTPDLKPNGANLQSQSTIGDLIFTPGMNSTSENQNAAPHLEDDSWSGILMSTFATEAPSTDGISGTGPAANFMPAPVSTDPVSPTLNQEPETFRESALIPTSTPPSQISASTHLPLQQSHHGTSMPVNEYGSIQYIAGQQHVNRTQTAVQALPAPAHTQTSLPQQRSSFNPPQALPSQTHAIPPVATDRQHQYSRVQMNPPQRPQMSSPSPSPLPPYQAPQNWYPQHPFLNQVAPQIGTYSASYSPTSGHPYFRPNQNLDRRHSPSLPQPYSNFARNHIPQGMVSAQQSGQVTRQPPSVPVSLQTTRQSSVPVSLQTTRQSSIPASLQTTRQSSVPASLQTTRQSSVPVSLQSSRPPSPLPFPTNPNRFGTSVRDQRISPGGTPQSAPGTDSQADYPGEQNWRPAGRMRGSLSGRAYNEARDQIILPVPPNQAAPRPALNMTMPLPGMSTTLHALMVHNRNLGLASLPVNLSPPTESTSVASGSTGVLPEVSSGMQGMQ